MSGTSTQEEKKEMKMRKRGWQAKTHTIFRPLYTCPDKYFFRKKANSYMTQCQNELRNWQTNENESGKMVSEKLK